MFCPDKSDSNSGSQYCKANCGIITDDQGTFATTQTQSYGDPHIVDQPTSICYKSSNCKDTGGGPQYLYDTVNNIPICVNPSGSVRWAGDPESNASSDFITQTTTKISKDDGSGGECSLSDAIKTCYDLGKSSSGVISIKTEIDKCTNLISCPNLEVTPTYHKKPVKWSDLLKPSPTPGLNVYSDIDPTNVQWIADLNKGGGVVVGNSSVAKINQSYDASTISIKPSNPVGGETINDCRYPPPSYQVEDNAKNCMGPPHTPLPSGLNPNGRLDSKCFFENEGLPEESQCGIVYNQYCKANVPPNYKRELTQLYLNNISDSCAASNTSGTLKPESNVVFEPTNMSSDGYYCWTESKTPNIADPNTYLDVKGNILHNTSSICPKAANELNGVI